jgi:hypothetical protein
VASGRVGDIWNPAELASRERITEDERRLYMGEVKTTEPHPAPWEIRAVACVGGRRERVFIVTDANRKCVAEFDDEWTAHMVVEAWNARTK